MTLNNKKTVFIVDDEEDVVSFLSMALEDEGFSVITASNGVEALERLNKAIPDAISLDVIMPGGSGIKFHRELKKKPEWRDIPVIIVTGHARDEFGNADFNEMTLSGPGVYLEKPVTATTYVRAIKSILGIEEDTSEHPEPGIREEIKSMVDRADPETLKNIMDAMKKNKD